MTDTNYYQPLITTNETEQNTLGQIQTKFIGAIRDANTAQNTMISSYMSANASRQACYNECPTGWSNETATWESEVEKDAASTSTGSATIPDATSCSGYDCNIEGQFCPKGSVGASAGNYICTNKKWVKTDSRPVTAAEAAGLKDVIASCKAGCDLKWPGIVQNKTRSQGVNVGKTVGRYIGTDGTEHDIGQCTDLAKYAPKVKLGGICDANEECSSDICVTWGTKCGTGSKQLKSDSVPGRCGLGVTRVDGSNYAWGSTFQAMCKSDVENTGLIKWPSHTQYLKFQNVWVKISDYGFPGAAEINNQRLENGEYIQDVATAIEAAEAYGDYCKGFYQQDGTSGFILQTGGGTNPKPSWKEFASEMSELNANQQEGFTADPQDNKTLIEDPKKLQAWGNFYGTVGGETVTAKQFDNPTFPIAKMDAAMKKTCPKGWRSIRGGKSCGIFNDDMRATAKGGGWNGVSFGCNLPNTDNHYSVDCEDVPNDGFTCWIPSRAEIPEGKTACKPIKGRDIGACLSSGGRAREAKCPVAAKMIVYIGRPGSTYFATKNNIVSVMQQISTEFPDVRLTDQKEMDDIIAKNIAFCAYGWYRTDTFSGTTWKTANASRNGPGVENLPLANKFPSNTSSGSGCGSGKQELIGGGGNKGGIYVTLTGTQEFIEQKLTGLGFTSWIVESHQRLIEKPPPPNTCTTTNLRDIKWCKQAGPWESDFGCCVLADKNARCPTGRSNGTLDGYQKCRGGVVDYDAEKKTCRTTNLRDIKWCKQAGPWESDFGCCVLADKSAKCPTGRSNGTLDGYQKCRGGVVDYDAEKKTCRTTNLRDIKWCKQAGPWESDFGCCVLADKSAKCPTGRSNGTLDGYQKCRGGSIESFVGGKEGFVGQEGYAPLEGDMITACKNAGTQGGKAVPGVAPTGDFLIKNRKKEKAVFQKLQQIQKEVKSSINKMQSDNLKVNVQSKTQNTELLKKLASYENANHKLLKAGSNLDTLGAQETDSLLRKNSVDLSYYLWLTLAISILGITITKIK